MFSLFIFYILLFSFFSTLYFFFFLSVSNFIFWHSFNFFINILIIFLLVYSFLLSDFSLYIVLINSFSIQDIFYKLFGLWCSHEGSLLFWYFCFNLYIFITFLNRLFVGSIFYKSYYIVLLCLLVYLILFSNPCSLLNFFIFEGLELNFLLHNPLVSIHPPFLYIGYLFTVFLFIYFFYFFCGSSFIWGSLFCLYVFAVLAWLCLSIGILVGSFWAYQELGWGGWWYWDAIENIAYLPWLILLLVIHVLRLNLYGNKFYVFNASLVLYSFLIVVFGTFFLRSGNLDSVHNFVIEFSRGYALVILVCLILLLCVFLFFFLQSYSFFFFFRKTKKSLLLVSFIFSTILYTLFVYSGTFFPFFCKIFFQDSVWVSASFYNLISLYYFTFILYLYFNFFWSNRLIYILGTLLSFILGAHFFMLTWSALGLFCFVLFCLGLVYLFFFRQGWSSLLHSLIVILFICIYTSQFFFNQDFLVSGFVGDQFFYQYFSLILGFPEYYTNDYFYCVVYPVYFYNTITGSIDYVFFLNKSIFLNSLSFSMKPEIFSTWIFDMYCNLLSYNQSYIYFNCSVKYFMLFFWVLVIFLLFISYISFIMFYRKVRYFIF